MYFRRHSSSLDPESGNIHGQPTLKSPTMVAETAGECTNMFVGSGRGRDSEDDCLLQSHIPFRLHWEMAGEPSDPRVRVLWENRRGGVGDIGRRRWRRCRVNSALPTNYYPWILLPTNFYPLILLRTNFYAWISITYHLLS